MTEERHSRQAAARAAAVAEQTSLKAGDHAEEADAANQRDDWAAAHRAAAKAHEQAAESHRAAARALGYAPNSPEAGSAARWAVLATQAADVASNPGE